MDFRNEIEPIGALSYLGNPLRKNVGASYRRGLEVDVSFRPTSRLTLSGNAAASMNRIRDYTDSSGDTPVTYHDVEPLLTPRFLAYERAALSLTHAVTAAVETRYQSRSFLQNTSDSRFVLPAAFDLDATLSWRVLGHYELVAQANNLLDSDKFGSGYASGGISYYYVVPPRNVFVTVKADF
jgi:iron complex outermembrane receptor protein